MSNDCDISRLRLWDITLSSLVNSGLDPIAAIRFGVKRECLRVQHGMLCMKVDVRTHHVICFGMKMDVRIYHMIWFGVQDVCSHAQYNILWCARWMFACTKWYALVCEMSVYMYCTCLLCCHKLLETIVLVLKQTWIAKSVIENELLLSLFQIQYHKRRYPRLYTLPCLF